MEKLKTVEYFDSRWYKREMPDGRVLYYPSVTTKLGIIEKPFLAKWRGDVGNREADIRMTDAQNRGNRIHNAWEFVNNGGVAVYNPFQRPNFTPEELKAFEKPVLVIQYQDEMLALWKLQRLQQIMQPEVLATELNVYSDKHQEAGTIDAVWKIKGGEYQVNGKVPLRLASGIYIVDLKTGGVFSDDTFMQVAAYASMYLENGYAESIQGTLGIHTEAKTKNGIPGLGVYESEDWDQDYKNYRVASDLWLIKHKDDKPNTFDFPSIIEMKGVTNETTKERI